MAVKTFKWCNSCMKEPRELCLNRTPSFPVEITWIMKELLIATGFLPGLLFGREVKSTVMLIVLSFSDHIFGRGQKSLRGNSLNSIPPPPPRPVEESQIAK